MLFCLKPEQSFTETFAAFSNILLQEDHSLVL